MSDKYIMALYIHCMMARMEAANTDVQMEGFTEKSVEWQGWRMWSMFCFRRYC